MELSYKGEWYPVRFHHTRFVYSNDKGFMDYMTKGGITFAYIKINEVTFVTAKAVCSLCDSFNKKIGRMMAMGRLKKKIENDKDCEKPPTKDTKELIDDIIFRC